LTLRGRQTPESYIDRVVATLTDANIYKAYWDYDVSITWNDGETSDGYIEYVSNGVYNVGMKMEQAR